MAQARKLRRKQAPEQGAREPTPGWVWLLLGMLIGLGMAALLYLQGADRWRLDQSWLTEPGTGVPAPAPPPAPRSPTSEETNPRFQFYDLLPRAEIAVPTPAPRAPTPPPPPRADESRLTSPQVLQTGSFRRFEQADELKAQLAFLGLQARIEEVRIGGQEFHRVFVGPFTTEAQLRRTEEQLRNANIEALRRPAS
jgi:cell division protein FtsN